jgi:hypothetical protein
MRKKFLPLLLLIICNIVLVLGNLYVTRHAFYDLEHTIYSQRTFYKAQAMSRMGNYYYETHQAVSDASFGEFITLTITDPTEAHFLTRYDIEKGFPIVWIGGNARFKRYQTYGSIQNSIEVADSLGIISKDQTLAFYDQLKSFVLTNDKQPYIVEAKDGVRYLLTWVIIPEPAAGMAKYVYFTLTPTTSLSGRIDDLKAKYVWLFSGSALLSGMMLVLIPIIIKRFL